MRRVIVDLLRCPRCRAGGLRPEADTAEVLFGPLRCSACKASYPVAEGVADLSMATGAPTGQKAPWVSRGRELPWVARSFERHLRPAFQLALAGRKMDLPSEYLLYRSLLGHPEGPVLELDGGTGLFGRRLSREPGWPEVVCTDGSRPMLEEAVAQAREAGVMLDFARTSGPMLPFQDQTLGAVLHPGALHLMAEVRTLFEEVARVLRPGGRYVASTYSPPRFPLAAAHRKAGLHPRSEQALRSALETAGLTGFERVRVPPFIVFSAEKPPLAPRV